MWEAASSVVIIPPVWYHCGIAFPSCGREHGDVASAARKAEAGTPAWVNTQEAYLHARDALESKANTLTQLPWTVCEVPPLPLPGQQHEFSIIHPPHQFPQVSAGPA